MLRLPVSVISLKCNNLVWFVKFSADSNSNVISDSNKYNSMLTLLRVSDLAYPVTLLRDGRGLEFYKGHSPLVPDQHR